MHRNDRANRTQQLPRIHTNSDAHRMHYGYANEPLWGCSDRGVTGRFISGILRTDEIIRTSGPWPRAGDSRDGAYARCCRDDSERSVPARLNPSSAAVEPWRRKRPNPVVKADFRLSGSAGCGGPHARRRHASHRKTQSEKFATPANNSCAMRHSASTRSCDARRACSGTGSIACDRPTHHNSHIFLLHNFYGHRPRPGSCGAGPCNFFMVDSVVTELPSARSKHCMIDPAR